MFLLKRKENQCSNSEWSHYRHTYSLIELAIVYVQCHLFHLLFFLITATILLKYHFCNSLVIILTFSVRWTQWTQALCNDASASSLKLVIITSSLSIASLKSQWHTVICSYFSQSPRKPITEYSLLNFVCSQTRLFFSSRSQFSISQLIINSAHFRSESFSLISFYISFIFSVCIFPLLCSTFSHFFLAIYKYKFE